MFITPASFSLDEYAIANSLNKTEISIIRGFMELNPDTRQAIYNVFSNAFNDEEDDILKYDEIPTAAEIEANYSPMAAEDLKGKNIG